MVGSFRENTLKILIKLSGNKTYLKHKEKMLRPSMSVMPLAMEIKVKEENFSVCLKMKRILMSPS